MCFPNEKTFREGFEEYILDCKARNLRDGTINHYQESIKQIYKRITPDTLISSMCRQTIRRIDSGTVGNAVPGKAEAVIEGILTDEIAEVAIATEEQTGIAFRWEEKNGCVVIRAEGKSAHASTPWEGNSALTGLLALLMQFPFADCEGQRRLRGLTELFPHGAFYGEAAGVAQADELSGRLVLSSNVLHYAEGGMSGRIDCCAPMCASEETVLEVLREKLAAYGLYLPESCKMVPPLRSGK